MIDSTLKNDATETNEAKEPAEPTENAELIDPMLMNEFFEAMLKAEFLEARLQRELCAMRTSFKTLPCLPGAVWPSCRTGAKGKPDRKWRDLPRASVGFPPSVQEGGDQ